MFQEYKIIKLGSKFWQQLWSKKLWCCGDLKTTKIYNIHEGIIFHKMPAM